MVFDFVKSDFMMKKGVFVLLKTETITLPVVLCQRIVNILGCIFANLLFDMPHWLVVCASMPFASIKSNLIAFGNCQTALFSMPIATCRGLYYG